VFGNAVGEVFLLGITAHVLERQHGNRRLVGQWKRHGRRNRHLGVATTFQSEGLPLTLNAWMGRSMLFRARLPRSSKARLQPTRHGFMDCTRDHNAACRSFRLKAGGDVHAIAVQIVTIDDQVAKVEAHTEHKRVSTGWSQLISATAC
jgi:hypothetical protein